VIIYCKRREEPYKQLFENAEIAIWNENFSDVHRYLMRLRKQGVTDLGAYLHENAHLIETLVSSVKVRKVNKASLKMFEAQSESQLLGSIQNVFGPGAREIFIEEVCAIWEGHDVFRAEASLRTFNGKVLTVIISLPVPKAEHGFRSIPVSILDITERKESEDLIWRQANFDTLTQLPNRKLFADRLGQEIKKSKRSGASFALLFIDIDNFKRINDTFGHGKGDGLLREFALRITASVRESDTVGRQGGDEFCIILSEVNDHCIVEKIIQKLLSALAIPFQLGENSVTISASIGISLYPKDTDKVEQLYQFADRAMYGAKNAGRNRHSYFSDTQINATHDDSTQVH